MDNITRSNKTARSNGAVGANALIPRFVADKMPRNMFILDYGCGPALLHVKALRQKGFNMIHAHDFGENRIGNAEMIAILQPDFYDLVYASNVFNTHSTAEMSRAALVEIRDCLKYGCGFVFNMPTKPNFFWSNRKAFLDLVDSVFQHDIAHLSGYQHCFITRKA